MSMCITRHLNCHSGENRNPVNRRRQLDSCLRRNDGQKTINGQVDFESTACLRTPHLQDEGGLVLFKEFYDLEFLCLVIKFKIDRRC